MSWDRWRRRQRDEPTVKRTILRRRQRRGQFRFPCVGDAPPQITPPRGSLGAARVQRRDLAFSPGSLQSQVTFCTLRIINTFTPRPAPRSRSGPSPAVRRSSSLPDRRAESTAIRNRPRSPATSRCRCRCRAGSPPTLELAARQQPRAGPARCAGRSDLLTREP